jgi:hypothetical protein
MDTTIQALMRLHSESPADADILARLLSAQARAGDARAARRLAHLLGESPKFVDYLIEYRRWEEGPWSSRMTYHIAFGNGAGISIQASPSHYCSDRRKILGYSDYTSWEIGFTRRILPPEIDGIIRWEDPAADWTVAGYVPTADVQSLFDYLYIEYGDPRSDRGEL